MRSIFHLMALVVAVFATVALTVPAARAQSASPWEEQRLRSLGYRLAQANAALCEGQGSLTGLMVHDISGFAAGDRAAARSGYGLATGFGVVSLVAGSAADKAGLRPGDEIVAVGGQRMEDFALRLIGREASYRRVEAFEDMLEGALASGPVLLHLRRDGAEIERLLVAERGCSDRFIVLADREANAWSDGRYVAVTATMMRHAREDGALAFVLAHEMAHNLLGHNGGRRAPLALLGGGAPRDRELAADRLALTIVRNAGFDPVDARDLLAGLAERSEARASLSHPGVTRRIAAIEAALARP